MALVVGTNAYIDVADATTYFSDSTNSSLWAALSATTQAQAIVQAARMLDRQTWVGQQTVLGQAMQWPRVNVTDKYGNPVDSSTVPIQVIDANAELALAITQDSSVETNVNTNFNIKSVKAEGAEVVFMRPSNGGRFPTIVQELVSQFLSGSQATDLAYDSGTDQESAFDPCDYDNKFTYTNGFS